MRDSAILGRELQSRAPSGLPAPAPVDPSQLGYPRDPFGRSAVRLPRCRVRTSSRCRAGARGARGSISMCCRRRPRPRPATPARSRFCRARWPSLTRLGFGSARPHSTAALPRMRPSRRSTPVPGAQGGLHRVYITGSKEPNSRRSCRRLYCYRAGARGESVTSSTAVACGAVACAAMSDGKRIWCGWAVFAYNLDTHVRRIE